MTDKWKNNRIGRKENHPSCYKTGFLDDDKR